MLIHGINPFIISRISTTDFRRVGKHPMFYRLRNRKHPILSIFWDGAADEWDGIWNRPSVCIHGANGKVILEIEVRSKDRANQLANELTQQLDNALSQPVCKMK
jgi:hypothetical protein